MNQFYIILLILIVGASVVAADTDITSTTNADARMNGDYPNNTYGTSVALQVGDRNDIRSVLNFTMSSGTGTISEVKLCLWRNYVTGDVYQSNISIHQLTGTFTESEVNWVNRSDGDAWSTPGGDYSSTIIDTVDIAATGNTSQWINWTIRGTGAINSLDSLTWGNTISFLLNQSTSDFRVDGFGSKENTSYAPFLEITYSGGVGPNEDSIDRVILTPEASCERWNMVRIGANLTHWNVSFAETTAGSFYSFQYDNDVEIVGHTAASHGESLWFNSSSLPTGIYKIVATAARQIVLQANEYGLVRKDTITDQTAQAVTASLDNEICLQWWNADTDTWLAHYSGDSYNDDANIHKHNPYFVLVSSATTIECPAAPAVLVGIPTGWSMTYLREVTPYTLAAIESDMGSNVQEIWAWNNATYSWVDAGSYEVQPNQGVFISSTSQFIWDGSVS